MPAEDYREVIGGHRYCNYCNRPWSFTHDCVQGRIVRSGLQAEIDIFVRNQEGRQERRHGRSARRRKLEILEQQVESLTNENETLIVVARSFRQILLQISQYPGGYDSGGHCGCFVHVKELAQRVIDATPAPVSRE